MSDFNKIIFGIYFWPKAGNAEHRALLAREGHIITVDDARGRSWRKVYGLGRFSADVPRRARGPRARCRGAIRTLLASPRAPNNRLASLHRDEGVSASCSANALLRAASTYLPLDGPRVNAMVGTVKKSLTPLSGPAHTRRPGRRLPRVSRRPPRAPESIAGRT